MSQNLEEFCDKISLNNFSQCSVFLKYRKLDHNEKYPESIRVLK